MFLNKLSETFPAFAEMTYSKLEETDEQWPLISSEDVYYGGTGYKNDAGLGAVLIRNESEDTPVLKSLEFIRPNDKELLAVPINKLYDKGETVKHSTLLLEHIGDACIRMSRETAARYKLLDGSKAAITIKGKAYQVDVILDENVPASVALVPRSMGIPIDTPATIQLKVA